MPDYVFKLRKESVEFPDAGYFPLVRKRAYFEDVKLECI